MADILGNIADTEYDAYLTKLAKRFATQAARGIPLFQTDPGPLFASYLATFNEGGERQYHTCSACRHFVNRYGALVTIDTDGITTPVMWDERDAPPQLREGIATMRKMVAVSRVTGVFLSSSPIFGFQRTGEWSHFSTTNLNVFKDGRLTAGQRMAELREEYGIVTRALREFTPQVVQQGIALLKSGTLYRSERVLPGAEWFRDVQQAIEGKDQARRNNMVWLAVALAPAGFTHIRGNVLGTLLQDLVAAVALPELTKKFNDKMDPANYHRAQSAPSAGQVDAAERAVQALGVAPAFARRYALAEDLLAKAPPGAYVWTPSHGHIPENPARLADKPAGVFGHLKPADPATPEVDIPPKLMTWEKFARDVLPGAARVEYRTPRVGRFCALTAPADPQAPHILQWDNGVSWAFPNPAASAEQWNLKPGELVKVRAIVRSPNTWSGDARFAHQGKGVFLLLDGAKDTRNLPGGGVFVEHLRNDLKPYRAVVQAHMDRLVVSGADAPDAAFGIGLLEGNDWTEVAAPVANRTPSPNVPAANAPKRVHVLLVVDDSGSMQSYIGAAREALSMLLAGVRAMPGEVDVTMLKFGTRISVVRNRVPLAMLGDPTREMTGGSGQTSLNDAIGQAIHAGLGCGDAHLADTSFFLGIVTDGEENNSREYTVASVHRLVQQVQATGRWTIAYAGAGRNPRSYARNIGIPEGNITGFEASDQGFRDLGAAYAVSTTTLSASYRSGARASTSFFASATGTRAIGTDLPVLVVTTRNGTKLACKLDRWE